MPRTTTVAVNGFALREIRIRSGIEVARLAEEIDVQRPFLTKLELGISPRMSATKYAALCRVLGVDRRALMANIADHAASEVPAVAS